MFIFAIVNYMLTQLMKLHCDSVWTKRPNKKKNKNRLFFKLNLNTNI